MPNGKTLLDNEIFSIGKKMYDEISKIISSKSTIQIERNDPMDILLPWVTVFIEELERRGEKQ